MKKKFYLLIIFLLTIFSAWLAKTPYYYETRIRDFNPDIIFKDDIDVKQLDITIDFSNNQIVDDALLGKVTTNYIIDNKSSTKAVVPFLVSLRENSSDYQSKTQKAFDSNLEYSYSYGKNKDKLNSKLITMSYDNLCDNVYKSKLSNDTYYLYEYSYDNSLILGVDYEAVNKYAFVTSNLAYQKLSKQDLNNLSDNLKNHAILIPTIEEKSYIISKINLDSYLSKIEDRKMFFNSNELFSYLLLKYDDVNYNDAITVCENEILYKFDQIGFNSISLDDIVNTKRLLLYELEIKDYTTNFNISYSSVTGMDSRYENHLYEFNYDLNKKNYNNLNKLNVKIILSNENSYLNHSILSFEKDNNIYNYNSNKLPIEIKYFFSGASNPQKSLDSLGIEVSGYLKYLIIPVLSLILMTGLVLFIYNKIKLIILNEKNFKNILKLLIDKFINYVPEILTFYLIVFKFYTLYKGDSTFNIANAIFVICFIIFCFIYFIFKTKNSVNYVKLIFYFVLGLVASIASHDYVFIMLILLALTYIEKGPKAYLRAMYISIGFMFIETLMLCGYGYLNNDITYIWDDALMQESTQERNSLGFGNPNTVSLFLFVGCACYILCEKKTLLSRIIICILLVGCYYYTHSRTGVFSLIILLISDIIADVVKIKGKWRYIFIFLFPFFAVLTYILVINFGYENNKLDLLLSKRLLSIKYYMNNTNWISLRGVPSISNVYIDNLYMNVLIFEGLITFFVYLILYILLSLKVVKSNNIKYLAVLITYFIFSMFEATLMSYSTAFFITILFISSLSDKYMIDGKIKDELLTDRVILHIVPKIEMATLDNNQKNIILVTSKNSKKEVKDNVEIYYNKGYIYIVVILIVFMKKYGIDKINVISPNNSVLLALLSINMQAKDIYIDAKAGFLKKQLSKKYNIKNELLEV